MKNQIIKFVDKVTLKSCLIVTAIFMIVLWVIDFSPIGVAGLLKVSNGVGILDFETRYTVEYAYDWLERMGQAGRMFHLKRVMPMDIIFPPCFMMFMFSWSSLLAQRATARDSFFRCLPVIAVFYMLLDWIENVGISLMLFKYPERLNKICVATGWISSFKKSVILCIIIICIVEFILLSIHKIMEVLNAKNKG